MIRNVIIGVALVFASSLTVFANSSERPELKLDKFLFGSKPLELSGAAYLDDGNLYIVSDSKTDHFLYRLDFKGNRYTEQPAIDLSKFPTYQMYSKTLAEHKELKKKSRRIDFEGLAVCGNKTYIANERVREVLLLEANKVTQLPIDLSFYKPLNKGGANAGFEGIAVDCKNQKMYLAKERDPRRLFTIDMKTWKVLKDWDVAPSDRANQKVINPFTGHGHLTVGVDFADLFFRKDHLYALERNSYEVAKIDPKTNKVISRTSFLKTEKGLYDSGEPFGDAEALIITKDHVIIGIDNNESYLGARAPAEIWSQRQWERTPLLQAPQGFLMVTKPVATYQTVMLKLG